MASGTIDYISVIGAINRRAVEPGTRPASAPAASAPAPAAATSTPAATAKTPIVVGYSASGANTLAIDVGRLVSMVI
jgi:hypothetical protein